MHDKVRGRWRAVPTAEQFGAFTQALVWRKAWRAGLADREGTGVVPPVSSSEAKRRAHYARQMARSEFGRSYWSDEEARRLREAMVRPKPAAKRDPRREG